MDIEAIFQFVADNPPAALIVGGLLLIVLSVFTAPIDSDTTGFLRGIAILLVVAPTPVGSAMLSVKRTPNGLIA
jgi:hypothetical protein